MNYVGEIIVMTLSYISCFAYVYHYYAEWLKWDEKGNPWLFPGHAILIMSGLALIVLPIAIYDLLLLEVL